MAEPKKREKPSDFVEVKCQEGKVYTGVMGAKFVCQNGRYVRIMTLKPGEKMFGGKKG